MQMNGKSAIIAFLVIYQKYGKMFVDYYKDKYSDDSSYHVPTTAPSRLFVNLFGCYKIINFLMNTFK